MKTKKLLSPSQLEELKQFDAPTICNGIEFFSIRPKTEGFLKPGIHKIFPTKVRTIGYACTAKISALHPAPESKKHLQEAYYRSVWETPKPTITVIQDIDPQPIGSFWGEVQATIHRYLGCSAVVTSGGVRDLDEVQRIGLEYFASCVLVSHAYVHVEEVGGPVEVGGLTVYPGDLIFADMHGIVVIPDAVAPYLAEACRAAQEAEQPVLQNCKPAFQGFLSEEDKSRIDRLLGWRKEMAEKRAEATRKFSALVGKKTQ
ncbi:MAG: RraA family protein [Spirochaetales bacterium]